MGWPMLPRPRQPMRIACSSTKGPNARAHPEIGDRRQQLTSGRLVVGLVYLDDRAVRILQENLVPAFHGPDAVIGKLDILLPQHGLERLDIVGAERDVAPVHRIEALSGAERDAEILRRNVKLG